MSPDAQRCTPANTQDIHLVLERDKNLNIDRCHALEWRQSYCFELHGAMLDLVHCVSVKAAEESVELHGDETTVKMQHKLMSPLFLFSLQKEISMDKTPVSTNPPGSLDYSLESLNKLNHSSSSSGSLYPDTSLSSSRRGDCLADAGKSVEDCCKVDEPSSSSFSSKPGADPVGSLSDSLYDSFSSCTSQGSNEV